MQRHLNINASKLIVIFSLFVFSIALSSTCFALSGCQVGYSSKYPAPEPQKNGDFDYTFEVCSLGTDGNVYLNVFGDDFTALGYSYGDSLNFQINDGPIYKDVPFFNGYLVDNDSVCVCDYPGDLYIWLARVNNPIGWETGAQRGDKVRVWRNEEAKYYKTQFQYSYKLSNNRDDYDSDEEFVNFRVVRAGSIGDNCLLRCCTPFCKKYYREQTAMKVLNEKNINCALDLYASDEGIKRVLDNYKNDYRAQGAKKLYEDGRILTLSINANYTIVEDFQEVADKLADLSEFEGPYLITCADGVDYTGYICILLECLCKSTYQEMRDDYMKSYEYLYGITEQNNKVIYDLAVKDDFNSFLATFTGVDKEQLQYCNPNTFYGLVKQRLYELGMTEVQIERMITNLSKDYPAEYQG